MWWLIHINEQVNVFGRPSPTTQSKTIAYLHIIKKAKLLLQEQIKKHSLEIKLH